MTVYVDDAFILASVPYRSGVVSGRWCHMTADTEEELNEFAQSIGLSRSWLQNSGRASFHYDVTEPRRKAAVRAGAKEITWREFGELILSRREDV